MHGYISSAITDKYRSGSPSCPWLIRALPGQKINVSVHSFLTHVPSEEDQEGGQSNPKHVCYEIASVHEPGTDQNLLACARGPSSNVFISTGNELEIRIPGRNTDALAGAFLIEYTGA